MILSRLLLPPIIVGWQEVRMKSTGVVFVLGVNNILESFLCVQVVDHVIWLKDDFSFSVLHLSAIFNSLARLYRNLSLLVCINTDKDCTKACGSVFRLAVHGSGCRRRR